MHALSLFFVIQRGMRIHPLGFCPRVIVDEKHLILNRRYLVFYLMRNWEPQDAMSVRHADSSPPYYLLGRPSLQHAVRASTMQ